MKVWALSGESLDMVHEKCLLAQSKFLLFNLCISLRRQCSLTLLTCTTVTNDALWEILTCFSTKMNHIGEQAFPCYENYISVYSCSSRFSNTSMNHGCSTNTRHNRQPDAHLISIWSLQYKIFSKTTITEAYQSQQNCSATTDCTRDKNSAKKNATHMMLMYHLCGCHINHGSLKYRPSYWISCHHQHIMKLVWPLFCTWITDCDPFANPPNSIQFLVFGRCVICQNWGGETLMCHLPHHIYVYPKVCKVQVDCNAQN